MESYGINHNLGTTSYALYSDGQAHVNGNLSLASSTASTTSYINQLLCYTTVNGIINTVGHMTTTTAQTTGICSPN
jgi:hypothetical protein